MCTQNYTSVKMVPLVEYGAGGEVKQFVVCIRGDYFAVPMQELGRTVTTACYANADISTIWAAVDPIWDGEKTETSVSGNVEVWVPGFPYEVKLGSFVQ